MLKTLQRYTELKEELKRIESNMTKKNGNTIETGRFIGYIMHSHSEASLPENLSFTFRDVKPSEISLDRCFNQDVSLKRWYELEISGDRRYGYDSDDEDFSDELYTIIHNGVCYSRYLRSEYGFYEDNSNKFQSLVKVKLSATSYKFKTEYHEVDDVLAPYSTVAEYGDIDKQKTMVDEKVRRGKDIDLSKHKFVDHELNHPKGRNDSPIYPPEQNGMIQVSGSLIQYIKKRFSKVTGMHNITVTPYKLNVYQNGDFFTDHQDTPEPNLVATVVILISGKSNAMVLEDSQKWEKGEMLIMFPDVLHRVDPVDEYRETMTFKVHSNWKPEPITSLTEVDKDVLNIADRVERFIIINKNFAVLLQNEYTLEDLINHYSETANVFPYKGVDQTLIQVMKVLETRYGFKLALIPVIINCYDYSDHTDYDKGYDSTEIRIASGRGGQNAGAVHALSESSLKEFEIPENLKDKFTDVPYVRSLYTLGYGDNYIGQALYDVVTHNVHYGNEYRGTLTSSVYFHYALVGSYQS
jgi:hypothetical protein